MRIGVDLGGTKIAAVNLSAGGQVVASDRCPTPRGYSETLSALADMIAKLNAVVPEQSTVGISLPGVIASDGNQVLAANLPWLVGQPFAHDLGNVLGRPVRLANDANCFALSEAMDGAVAGEEVVFGVILGTGVGGGLVVRGQIIAGANALAGEWGHIPLPWRDLQRDPPVLCSCGRMGCLETELNGKGLSRTYHKHTGEMLDGAAIAERLRQGEAAALATLEHYADNLARALVGIIHVLDPNAIVLGGGLSELPGLVPAVTAAWNRYALASPLRTKLAVAQHGPASGMRGAAWLWR